MVVVVGRSVVDEFDVKSWLKLGVAIVVVAVGVVLVAIGVEGNELIGSPEPGVRLDNNAVGSEVTSAADQMTSIIIFACTLDILNRIGYIMAKYLSILIATIV